MSIKGQYIARVVIDFDIPANASGYISYEDISQLILSDAYADEMCELIQQELTHHFKVTVTRETSSIEQTEDETP